MKSYRRTAALLCGVVLLAGVSSARAAGPTTVKVGVLASLSGYVASYGLDERDGSLLAIEEINKANAIPGVKLEPVIIDDKGDPTATVEAAQQAIGAGAVAIVGPTTSGGSGAIASVVTARKIPAVTYGIFPLTLQVTPATYAFSLSIDSKGEADGDLGVALAQHIPIKNVAIIYDTNAYGQSILEGLKNSLAAKSINIVATEAYKSTDTDMSPQLTRIRNAKPDFIFDVGGGTAPALIARQKFELGMPTLMLISVGSFGIGDKKLAEIAGERASASVRAAVFAAQVADSLPASPKRERIRKFIADFEKTFKRDPVGYASMAGYDAAWALATAMKQAGSTEPDKVQAALEKTKFAGTLCDVEFTATSHSACHANAVVGGKMVGAKLQYGS